MNKEERKQMPSQGVLNSLFHYNDGVLYWKVSPSRGVKAGDIAGCKKPCGRIEVGINGFPHKLHRIVYTMFYGHSPDLIDHIDCDPSNNRIENLRAATKSTNSMNSKIRIDNCSGVKNVTWKNKNKKWQVRIAVNGVRKSFGLYEDLELAELVAIEARNKFHGSFANHG